MLENFPSLTVDEFEKACKSLEEKCHDRINGTKWQSVNWNASGELNIRQMSTQSGKSIVVKRAEDDMEAEVEEDEDTEAMEVIPTRNDQFGIDFFVMLSPTYQVPVLYFAMSSSASIRLSDLDMIYSRIVPANTHGALQRVGVMGGISIANHPVTDKPMFFVHPCLTRDALTVVSNGVDLDPLAYLLLWFGIVGASVGLHVPSKVVA